VYILNILKLGQRKSDLCGVSYICIVLSVMHGVQDIHNLC